MQDDCYTRGNADNERVRPYISRASVIGDLTALCTKLKILLLLACAGAAGAQAQPQAWAWDDGTVPYVQTPMEVVERMLRMAESKAGDYVIDLGSGDGRIVIEAAKRGARGLGVDIDPSLVRLATENARKAGVAARAQLRGEGHLRNGSRAGDACRDVLLPDFNLKLRPRLLALKPGTRIVSHDGGMGDWPPDEKLEMRAPEKPVGVGGVSRV